MTLKDIGELVVLIIVNISVPTFYAISKAKKGEPFANSKLPLLWPILVGAVYAYYLHSINPYWTITPFIGSVIIGVISVAGVYSLIEKRIKEKERAKEEIDRREEEIRELRKEIKEMQDKEKGNH